MKWRYNESSSFSFSPQPRKRVISGEQFVHRLTVFLLLPMLSNVPAPQAMGQTPLKKFLSSDMLKGQALPCLINLHSKCLCT